MTSILDQLTGQQISGGCDDCDAYRRVIEDAPGMFTIRVFHDETCPYLMACRNRG